MQRHSFVAALVLTGVFGGATAGETLDNRFFPYTMRHVPPEKLVELGFDHVPSVYTSLRLTDGPASAPAPELVKRIEDFKTLDGVFWLTVQKQGIKDDGDVVPAIRKLAETAREGGVKIALYPHAGFYVATARDAYRVAGKVDRPTVGVTINLCHELMAGNADELPKIVDEVADRLFVVTVNGADRPPKGKRYGWDRLIQPLGKGDFDVYGFLRHVRAAGFRGPIGLQCFGIKGDPLVHLNQSIAAWRSYRQRMAAEGGGKWTVVAKGQLGLTAMEGNAEVLWLDIRALGPGWVGPKTPLEPVVRDGSRVVEGPVHFGTPWQAKPINATPVELRISAEKSGPNRLTVHVRCRSAAAIDLVGIGPVIQTLPALNGATVTIDAEPAQTLRLPHSTRGSGKGVKRAVVSLADDRKVTIDFAQPGAYHLDRGETRLWAISGELAAGATAENTLTITFPGPVTFEPANRSPDMASWFLFRSRQDVRPGSPLGMEDWLDKPAGKHGFVQVKDDRFVCEDGTAIKFWGTNISWDDMAVPKETADRWADKFAKYGVNLVRMHKFVNCGWAGIMADDDSLKIVEEEAALFDVMHTALAERGIYAGWSPLFGYWLREADRDRVWAYDEIVAARKSGHFKGRTYGIVNVAPDLQDLYIKATVQMLNRVNTVTGKRYAEDPSLAFVELHNEDDIFFFGIGDLVAKCPTYKKHISKQFCQWLSKRYDSEETLRKTWTSMPLRRGENLLDGTIYPFPGWWNPGEQLPPRRVVDSYRFLFEFQNGFYDRYVKAIRETGYKGAIVGSCWQAADWLGHLCNIQSDRRVGFIDRHNYFRGAVPMVTAPGSALLSAGMQQVADRPFGLSEWAAAHSFRADATAILGIYGMGLQGWDLSAQFCSSFWGVRTDGWGNVNDTCDMPVNLAQYPAIARAIHRGDVKEGDVVSTRRVSMKELSTGKVGFIEKFVLTGGANNKTFTGSVPREALAAGRVVIEYVDEPAARPLEQETATRHIDPERRLVRSTTGQLRWDYSGRGFFTVNTPGTQAVVGFGGGASHELADVTIWPRNLFSLIYISAAGPSETIADAEALVITTLARMVEKGTVLGDLALSPLRRPERKPIRKEQQVDYMLKNPSLLVEPVAAEITLKTKRPLRVYALDHDGRKPGGAKPLPVERNDGTVRFVLDGAKTETLYYVVEFDK